MSIKKKLNKHISYVQIAAQDMAKDAISLLTHFKKFTVAGAYDEKIDKIIESLDCERVNENISDFEQYVTEIPISDILSEVEDDPEEILLIMKDQMISLPDNYVLIKMNDIQVETDLKKYLDNEEFNGRIEIIH